MARRKNTPSSIDRLPKKVRETINRLRTDHGWTIDQLLEKLEELGHAEISRSALGRHVRSLAEVTEQMRETQAMAEALAREVGNSSQSELLDANAQMLQGHLLRLMMASADGQPVQLSAKEAKDTADAIRSITLARKSDLEVIGKAEERAAAKARAESAERATTEARNRGLQPETVDQIRRAVLGSDA